MFEYVGRKYKQEKVNAMHVVVLRLYDHYLSRKMKSKKENRGYLAIKQVGFKFSNKVEYW